MPFFSIVVPVYNSSRYLASCLDSILEQTFVDFEVVLVDDGSTDDSFDIAKGYRDRDKRIVLLQQENSGTSAARNTGINAAQGAYITFIDNDDLWVDPRALEEVAAIIDKYDVDIVMHQSFDFYGEEAVVPEGRTNFGDKINGATKEAALRCLIEEGLLCAAVWCKVFRAALFHDDGLNFPSGMRNEDIAVTAKAIRLAKSFGWVDVRFYAYRNGHDEAQTSKALRARHVNDLSTILVENMSAIEASDDSANLKKLYFSYLAYPYCVWMGQSALFGKRESCLKNVDALKTYASLLKYDLNPSVKLAFRLYSIMGYGFTRWALGKYMRHLYKNIKIDTSDA